MRIISFNSPYGAGGIGQHAAQLVEETRIEDQLHCYFSNRPKTGDEKGRSVGISTLGALKYTPLRFSPSWKSHLSNELFDEAVARRLEEPVDRFMGFAGKALRSFRQARRLGARLLELVVPNSHIANVYASHQQAGRDIGIYDSWLNKAQVVKTLKEYAWADRIYTHSAYTEESLLARGVPKEKLRRTHLTVDERFGPPDERPEDDVFRIAYVGRVDATKGVPRLLEAFEQVPIPGKRLHIMGGWSTRAMRKFMEGYMTDERITVGPGDPLPLLQRADVFVHPTYEDGFGYAPMEALACGLPVIVTLDTGMKEYVHEGKNGYVVPTGSVKAFCESLLHIYETPLAATQSLQPASASGSTAHFPIR
jgi:glycosyltransferase involved in cell wall biosynthesis